jgi:competence protein ComEC
MSLTTTQPSKKTRKQTTAIHFKNVDQGDSIIIEWTDNNLLHIGIIDCAVNNDGENPVLEHLKNIDTPYSLHFMIFTHPHKDHYSGVLELLEYIENGQIPVAFFCHTYYYHIKFRDGLPPGKAAFLTKFAIIAKRIEKSGLFKESIQIGSRTVLPLSAGLQLRCLSPSNQELGWYQAKLTAGGKKGEKQSSSEANLLSAIIKIETKNAYSLFTADGHIHSFERLHKNITESKNKQKVMVGQVPHHGSIKNYHKPFWHALKRKPKTAAVISVGENDYTHPSANVLQSLHAAGYKVHCTNIVNDAVAFYNKVDPKVLALVTALDDISTVVNEKRHLSFEMPF